MPALPFDPVDLSPVLPDVLWAIGIAFVLAFVTSRPARPRSFGPTELPASDIAVSIVEDEDEDGS